MKPATSNVLIASIRRNGGTQIRAALDESTVAEYAAAWKSGPALPPVAAYYDGKDHWLSDGFHRVEAALRAGARRIDAVVTKGTRRDAILAACKANAEHGLRRSNADKRRAVDTLLADPEWTLWSNRRIAKETQVSDVFVAECRDRLRDATSEQLREVTPHGGANVCTGSASNSKPGQPTAALPPFAANPALEGDEGAGEPVTDPGRTAAAKVNKSPAPSIDLLGPGPVEEAWFAGERAKPNLSIDLLGLDGIDPAWLELAEDIGAAIDAFDNSLRSAQGAVSGAACYGTSAAQLQPLRIAAHDLAARARGTVRPRSVCLYCKDPDGEQGRRAECNGCRGLGWLTSEQLGAVPRELLVRGEAARVIDQKAGGYVPREVVVERDDEDEDLAF